MLAHMGLSTNVHDICQQAFQHACGAQGHEDEQLDEDEQLGAPADQAAAYRRSVRKREKRSVAWLVHDKSTPIKLLLWLAIAFPVMHMHYSLFRDGMDLGGFSDASAGSLGLVFDLCSPSRSLAGKALEDLSKIVLSSRRQHPPSMSSAFRLLDGQWPEDIILLVRSGALLVMGSMWRRLVLPFEQWPWKLALVFDTRLSLVERETIAEDWFNTPRCCLDPGLSRKVKSRLRSWRELFDQPVQQFLKHMFLRAVLSTAYVECQFASYRQWVQRSSRPVVFRSLAAKHVTSSFSRVHRWLNLGRGRRAQADAQGTRRMSRPIWINAKFRKSNVQKRTRGLDVFISEFLRKYRQDLDAQGRGWNSFQRKQAMHAAHRAWRELTPEQRQEKNRVGAARSVVARLAPDPLQECLRQGERELSEDRRCSPWGLGGAEYPLRASDVEWRQKEPNFLTKSVHEWGEFTRVTDPDRDFPENVVKQKFCSEFMFGRCRQDVAPVKLEAMAELLQDLEVIVAPVGGDRAVYSELLLFESRDQRFIAQCCSHRKQPFVGEFLPHKVPSGDLTAPFATSPQALENIGGRSRFPLMTESQLALHLVYLSPDPWQISRLIFKPNPHVRSIAHITVVERLPVDMAQEKAKRAHGLEIRKAMQAMNKAAAGWQTVAGNRRPQGNGARGRGRGGRGRGRPQGAGRGQPAHADPADADDPPEAEPDEDPRCRIKP